MPQPIAYVRDYDFTNFQEQFPNQSLPAAPLDANLDKVGISVGQIVARLPLIQRDDGQLKNQIVTPDALSNTVKALLGSPLNPRGNWIALTDYARLDLVGVSGVTYICVQDHSSGGSFSVDRDAGKWLLFSNAAAVLGSSFFQEITGTGSQEVFTMTADLGTDENAIMFFLEGSDGFDIQSPSSYTINGTDLTVSPAPALNAKGRIFAPSLLLGAASSSAADALAAQTAAESARDDILSNAGFIAVAADLAGANNIGAVGSNIADVSTVAGIAADVTTVAGSGADISAVAGIAADVTTVATNIADVNTCATNIAAIIDAPAQASAAAASAAAAAAAAAEGLYNDVVTITFADSPFTPPASAEGTLYRCDTSGGNIVVNFSALATYGEDMKFAFAKTTGDANTVTVNRGGTNTIDGGTSKLLDTQYVIVVFVGDEATGAWLTATQNAPVADNSVTNAKLADMPAATFKMRAVGAGTGDPIDGTATQATAALNAFTGDSGSGGVKGLVPAPASGDAAANKYLHADGTFKEIPAAGITNVVIQVFTSSGTYTPTTGMKYCIAEGVGGGAAGAGRSGAGLFMSGGGAGGRAIRRLTAAQIGASKPVTIGAAGVGVAGGSGGNGGTTSLDTLLTANGGVGGTFGASAQLGGVGGTAASGDINANGAPAPAALVASFGHGGASGPYGAGGQEQFANANGNAALGRGAGGGASGSGGGSAAGGNGTAGILIITEYI